MEKTKSKRARSSKMNLLYMKNPVLEIGSKPQSLSSLDLASGDCYFPAPRCMLCKCGTQLRNITVDHCELLSHLYDVEVPDTGKICEACVKCMKVCQRFKILVNTSLVKKPSETGIPICDQSNETDLKIPLPSTNPQRAIIDLLTATLTNKSKKKNKVKSDYLVPSPPPKKSNVVCSVCQQKYVMFTPQEGLNDFICCRCKHNNESKRKTSFLPANNLHTKIDLMGRTRLSPVSKSRYSPPPGKTLKHQCHSCPKSYVDPQNLVKHIKTVHDASYACVACGKQMTNKDAYDRHLRLHPMSKSDSLPMKNPSFKRQASSNK